MFKLALSPAYYWPVKLGLPVDGGDIKEVTFEAQFRRLTLLEGKRLGEAVLAEKLPDDEVCRRIVLGWRQVSDDTDAEIAFTREAFERLLAVAGAASAIVRAYGESIQKAAEKNS